MIRTTSNYKGVQWCPSYKATLDMRKIWPYLRDTILLLVTRIILVRVATYIGSKYIPRECRDTEIILLYIVTMIAFIRCKVYVVDTTHRACYLRSQT